MTTLQRRIAVPTNNGTLAERKEAALTEARERFPEAAELLPGLSNGAFFVEIWIGPKGDRTGRIFWPTEGVG